MKSCESNPSLLSMRLSVAPFEFALTLAVLAVTRHGGEDLLTDPKKNKKYCNSGQ